MSCVALVNLLVFALYRSVTSNVTKIPKAHQDYIFNGVSTIRATGSNSLMTVFGDNAFTLAAGKDTHDILSPMGAGGTFGKARMAGFTLNHLLYPEDLTNAPGGATDQNQFLLNLYKWLAGEKLPKTTAFIGHRYDPALEFLKKRGMKPTVIRRKQLAKHKSLKGFDVVVIREHITVDHVPLLRDYVNGGGGIAAAFDMVQWMSKVKIGGEFASNFPPNMISKDFGFVWRDDNYDTRSWIPHPHSIFNVAYPALAGLTFFELWNSMKAAWQQPVSREQLPRLFKALEQNARSVPKEFFVSDSNFYTEALSLTRPDLQPVPTIQKPISSYTDKYKLLMFDSLTAHVLKPEDVVAHPSSDYFPWASEQNRTQTQVFWRNITLNKDVDALYSTGLYAEAGKVVTVKLDEYSSLDTPVIELRIGSGLTDISKAPEWHRPSIAVREIHFQDQIATFNTPYGGAIYVVSFDKTKKKDPTRIILVVSGAISAPYFKLGETSVKEWRETIRTEPAPWAELVTENIILSVPSTDIRTLEDPNLVLDVWARAADAMADFVQISHNRPSPVRFYFDVQMPEAKMVSYGIRSAGFFLIQHSSKAMDITYMLSLEGISFWYILATQFNHFAFYIKRSKMGAATSNLLILYVFDKLAGLRPAQAIEHLSPPYYQPKIKEYIRDNRNFSNFLDDPWLSLVYYVQLQEMYGWENFQHTLVEYRSMAPNEKRKGEDEVINLWVYLLSKSVGRNLYDFHKSWGFPLGQDLNAGLLSLNYSMDPTRMEDLL